MNILHQIKEQNLKFSSQSKFEEDIFQALANWLDFCNFENTIVRRMIRKTTVFGILALTLTLGSCEILGNITGGDAASALKEALRVGTDTSVARTSAVNGFYGDALIKILLPEEAQTALVFVEAINPQLVADLELKINRAAEKAATEATPIFANAITSITFDDALQILNGPDDAATVYLKGKTKQELQDIFQPIIEEALTEVGAQQLWSQFCGIYNGFNPGNPVPDNLAQHTTSKALDGIYVKIAEEEMKIRNDVNHQVTDLLKQYFGN